MWTMPDWINYSALHIWLILYSVCPISTNTRSKCLEGTVKSQAEDCSIYWQCLNGETVLQSCPTQSYFDPAWEVCVIDVSGRCVAAVAQCAEGQIEVIPGNSCGFFRCVNGSLEEEKCQLGSYFNASLKLCEIDENGICDSKQCSEGSLQADPKDCSGYLMCVDGNLIEKKCAKVSFFNADLKICEIDENGICDPNNDKCTEGSLEADPKDCSGYLICVDGNQCCLKDM
ncbi:PREDICTED: tenascin-like [Drosophila arizonae]|uniref:Tenascin-like n=1 Tax=Drosophila arizonae TaxID=7263 RepID=A0ABM1P0A7_DROAR|nr:PREDICTED: tenascin-like [Drosophila arizonae]